MSERLPSLIVISVIGGTGNKTVTLGGNPIGIGIKTPAESPTYDIEITDADGFGIFGGTGLKGRTSFPCKIHFFGDQTMTISNATVDGTYQVKVWYQE